MYWCRIRYWFFDRAAFRIILIFRLISYCFVYVYVCVLLVVCFVLFAHKHIKWHENRYILYVYTCSSIHIMHTHTFTHILVTTLFFSTLCYRWNSQRIAWKTLQQHWPAYVSVCVCVCSSNCCLWHHVQILKFNLWCSCARRALIKFSSADHGNSF